MNIYSDIDMHGGKLQNCPSVFNHISYADFSSLPDEIRERNAYVIFDWPFGETTVTKIIAYGKDLTEGTSENAVAEEQLVDAVKEAVMQELGNVVTYRVEDEADAAD